MTSQYYSFIIFIFIGIILSLIYDLFRILRKTYHTPDIITYLEDICFWLISGITLLYSIFEFNNGKIRGYIFIGLFFGIFIYILAFSKTILTIGTKTFKIINTIIIKPFFKLVKNILNTFTYIFSKFSKKIIKNLKK